MPGLSEGCELGFGFGSGGLHQGHQPLSVTLGVGVGVGVQLGPLRLPLPGRRPMTVRWVQPALAGDRLRVAAELQVHAIRVKAVVVRTDGEVADAAPLQRVGV